MMINSMNGFHTRSLGALFALTVIVLGFASPTGAVPWMFQPTSEPHSLSNNYCEFQDYGYNYYHDGIDVIKPNGGVPVYSVTDGWMTHESPGTMYGGIMIGDQYAAGATGWLYWHMPNSTFPFNVGDRINEGDYIGDIAWWSVYDFHHVHFNRVVGTGGLPWGWYDSTDNPLDWLEPNTDPQPPTIYNAVGTDLLAFCVNNTSNYLNPNSLEGDVDIIAKIGDLCWNGHWEIIPYRIEYTIASAAINEHRLAFIFDDQLPPENTILTVYKDDYICNSAGNYTDRDFFFILTNNDGDDVIEVTDNEGKWYTTGYPAGTYTITVDAYDAGGNLTQDSMEVNVLAAPTYDVSITLTPTSSLQLPASGGSFTYTAQVQNNEATSVTFDAWISMTYPDSTVVQLIHRNLSVPAGGNITRNLIQTIAGSEPNGTYYYEGKVGHHPYNHWDSDGFNFTKGIDAEGTGFTVHQTNLSGWDEAEIHALQVHRKAPGKFELVSAYPNPFNPSTTLSYALPEAAHTSLKIYDITGREVATLEDGWKEAGSYEVAFDGSNAASGIYFFHLKAGENESLGKMVLVK